ncbi:MAG: hypothetical protein CVV50_03070, partial [Spirochaetae bacterium HGW-Spirochaetae-6]
MNDIKWAGASTPAFFLTKVLEGKSSFVPRTYLFHGAPESGKSFWAIQFFRALNCPSSSSLENQNPQCCTVCKNISRLQITDLYPIITHFDAGRFLRVLGAGARGGKLNASLHFWIGQELYLYLRLLDTALFNKNDSKLVAQKDFLQTWLEKVPDGKECAEFLDYLKPDQNPLLTKVNVSYDYVREMLKKEFDNIKELIHLLPNTTMKEFVNYYQSNEDQLSASELSQQLTSLNTEVQAYLQAYHTEKDKLE